MKKILIAEDSAQVRETLKSVVEMWGYEADTASDGSEALRKMEDSPPDLVIIDIMMPVLHGLNLLQKIKAGEKTSNIKVVIYTGKDFESEKAKALELGADAYVTKAENIEILKSRIKNLLEGEDTSFNIEIFGARGSIPAPGKNYEKYGGNTSCVKLKAGESLFILDAGTGIRELGRTLSGTGEKVSAFLLFTHTHWDHIQGFPFFAPAYDPGNEFIVYGPRSMDRSLEDTFKLQFDPNYFPVSVSDLSSRIRFRDLTEESFSCGPVDISTVYLNHPGMTLGYAFKRSGRKICYITDNELTGEAGAESVDGAGRLSEFISGSDLCIMDAQYTDLEYPEKRGWGHSPIGRVLSLAEGAGVSRLILFHHDPDHTDEDMDLILDSARERSGISVDAAREGDSLDI